MSSSRIFWMARAVAVPIGDEIVRDAVQPRREGRAARLVLVDVTEGAIKHARRQVFRFRHVPDAIKNVIVDAIHEAFVQFAERIRVAPGTPDQGFFCFGQPRLPIRARSVRLLITTPRRAQSYA